MSRKALLGAALVAASTLLAQDMFCLPIDLSGGAEALYWRPCQRSFRYGFYDNNNNFSFPSQIFLDTPEKYSWGFRLYGTVASPCSANFASLEWAHVASTVSHTAYNDMPGFTLRQLIFVASTRAPNSLFAEQHSRYNKVSAKFGHQLCRREGTSLYLYGGGRWVEILSHSFSEGTLLTGPSTTVRIDSEFSGGAIEVGFGGHRDVWCGIGASIRMGAMAVLGKRTSSLRSVTGTTVNIATDFSSTPCLGAFEARVAVDYTYRSRCWWIRGEVGYELDYYFDPLIVHMPTGVSAANVSGSLAEEANFAIGGLVLGVTIGF